MNAAKGVDKETDAIVERMFGLNFAAIHTSSMVSYPNSRLQHELTCVPGNDACLVRSRSKSGIFGSTP